MEKITAMKLTRLTVGGFRCFASERSFDLDDMTYITGSNHVGKSSIADAIAFAFTGKLYSGDSAIDRLYNEDTPKLRVSVSLIDERGAAHELVRTRARDKVAITFDGYSVRQKDMDAIFGESDVFLSILNPTFFIERLGNDGQKLLQTYLPLVSHEAVLQKLSDYQRTLLENRSLLSPDVFIGKLREEIREYGEGIIALEGQEALLLRQKLDSGKELDGLQAKIDTIDGGIGVLRQKRENGVNLRTLAETREALLLRRDEILSDRPKASPAAQLDLNIARAEAELESAGQRQYESKYTQEIAKLEAELAADGDAYRRACGVLQNLRPGVTCPTCLRKIKDDGDVGGIKAELEPVIQGMLQRGKEKRNQLTELQEFDGKARAVFGQFKADDEAKAAGRVAELKAQWDSLLAQPPDHEVSLSEINRQIADAEADIDLGGLTAEEKTRLDGLEAEKERLTADHTAMKTLLERPEPDIEGKKKELEDGIKHKEELIAAALDYLGARNELTFQNLPLDKVAFSLLDILKTTGEVKNAFRFTYNGRDYRKLSHSEKIFAGMEVSELMKALTGRNYPVFVDDSESVVSLASVPTGQVFLSRVVPDQVLTVVGKSYARNELPKAS